MKNNQTKPTGPDQCIGSDIHFNSISAFDMNSGRIRWSRQLRGYGVFYFACLDPNNKYCPTGPNLDADFGEVPMLLRIISYGRPHDVAVAVQKSSFVWALGCNNGDKVWFNLAGPGGKEGGGIWGAASEGRSVYTNIPTLKEFASPLHRLPKQQQLVHAWVALDANFGEIVWSTANPSEDTSQGPVSVVNGVIFVVSVASNGTLYATDTNNAATIYVGVSASYGCIYHGNGYTVGLAKFHPTWTGGNSLLAFCVI